MTKIGLKTRLILAVAFMGSLMALIGYLGFRGMSQAESKLLSVYNNQVLPMVQLREVADAYGSVIVNECHKVGGGQTGADLGAQTVKAAKDRGERTWKLFLSGSLEGKERALAEEAQNLKAKADTAIDQAVLIMEAKDRDRLNAFNTNQLFQAVDPFSAKLRELMAQQKIDAGAQTREGEWDTKRLIIGALGLGILFCLLVGSVIARMANDLGRLIEAVHKSGLQVNTSVTEIAATAREQQATASEVAATTSEIGATAKEISSTSRELLKSVTEVARVAEHTAELAAHGQTGLSRMEDTMRLVMEAGSTINSKLSVLNEKAGNINQVVTTITKVADQTNLLSLNAAIEAEKAGEYGRGFAVVATEIRRLADQTAVATYDIEQMVKEMESAVTAGVMGMDKFSEEVRRGVKEVQSVGSQLGQIIRQVQTLTPQFERVQEGMESQSGGAHQISEALSQLSEAAQQTVESLQQSNAALARLNEASTGLKTGVESIRV